MKTIILGLGNPILGDDAIGCRIAEELEKVLPSSDDVIIEPFYRGGIALMEHLVGFDRALLIDSIQGLGGEPGTIHQITLDDLPTMTADSPHDTSLKAAIELGRNLGAHLPQEILIFAVEIKYGLDFTEELSPVVEKSISEILTLILENVKIPE